MVGVHDLPMFVVAGLLLAMSPGPDTAYILGRSAQSGWRGGAVAALGIAVGIWVHILAAAAGLSALLMASARGFMVAKLVGAAYLLFLGFKMIARTPARSRGRATGRSQIPHRQLGLGISGSVAAEQSNSCCVHTLWCPSTLAGHPN